MRRSPEQKVVFFGCPLDGDEKNDAIAEKLSGMGKEQGVDDPLVPVLDALSAHVPDRLWELAGSVPVPGWLRPMPADGHRPEITAAHFVAFTDEDGCRRYADKVERLVTDSVLPGFPCMVAVDHALTGGAYRALADHYGRDQLSLVVVDSHTDAVPTTTMAGAIQYDLDTNPGTVYDRSDPLLHDRPDAYHASSFLHHLLAEGTVHPRDLFIVGISDFPEKRVQRIGDPRIAQYVAVYTRLKQRGVTLVTKQDCRLKPTKVKRLLNKIRTPYVYVSIDMDIGARNAVEGVRFRNWQGLSEPQVCALASAIADAGGPDRRIVGMDLTEFNPRTAGMDHGNRVDRTYEVAAGLIRRLAFEIDPRCSRARLAAGLWHTRYDNRGKR